MASGTAMGRSCHSGDRSQAGSQTFGQPLAQPKVHNVAGDAEMTMTSSHIGQSVAFAVVEDGLRCRVEGPNGATIHTDMPAGVGGESRAPSPGWYLRAGLASCAATLIIMRAAELGLRLRHVEVAVDSESDDRGILAMDAGVRAGPLSLAARV